MKEIYRRIPQISNNRIQCPFCSSKLQRSNQPVYEYWPYGETEETELPLLRCYKCRINFINQKIIDEYDEFCYEKDYPCDIKTFDCKGTKEEVKQKALCGALDNEIDAISSVPETPSKEYFANFEYEHNDIERKLTKEMFDMLECPPSTIGVVFYEMPKHPKDTLRKAYIVLDKEDEATSKRNSYHIKHPYSRIIIECLGLRETLFTYQEQYRKLHYFYGNKKLYDILKGYKKISLINNASFDSLVDICVYHGKGLCGKHHRQMEMVTARVIGTRTKEPQDLQVYYCPLCDEYYINYEYYREFALKNGIPPLRLFDRRDRELGGDYYANLNAESILATYGYRVSGSMQSNPKARQRLLEDLIDMELLQKAEIISHIEWLMRFRSDAYNAQWCWKSDLDHIRHYQKNRQRLVRGVFVAGKNKILK